MAGSNAFFHFESQTGGQLGHHLGRLVLTDGARHRPVSIRPRSLGQLDRRFPRWEERDVRGVRERRRDASAQNGERGGHLLGGGEPIVGASCARAHEPIVEAIGNARVDGGRERGSGCADLDQQVAEVGGFEGASADEGFERDDTEGPQVGTVVDAFLALGLFGAHVVGRSEHHAGAGTSEADAPDGLGDAEVEDLDDLGFPLLIGAHVDVVRLHVAVDDAAFVGADERARNLGDDGRDGGWGEAAVAVEPGAEVFAFEQLHGDVRDFLPDAEVEDLNDVGGAQGGRSAGFSLES